VYVCKGCTNDCPDGAVVAVRSEGPGDYSNDEVGSGAGEGSASPSNKEPSSGDEEEPKKEAGESCSDGEQDRGSPNKKGSFSDDEVESKEKAGQAHNGDGASLEEVEKSLGQGGARQMETRTSSRFDGRDMGQRATHGNQRKLCFVLTSWRPSGTNIVAVLVLV
jgi:hypothetical protein